MSLVLGGTRALLRHPRYGIAEQIAVEANILHSFVVLPDGRCLISVRDSTSRYSTTYLDDFPFFTVSFVPGPATGLYLYDRESGGAAPFYLTSGTAPWEFRSPSFMALNRAKDAVWVADAWSQHLHKISFDGFWMNGITIGDGYHERFRTSGMAVDANDNLWAISHTDSIPKLWSYTSSGVLRQEILLDPTVGSYDMEIEIRYANGVVGYETLQEYIINEPKGIGVDLNGNVWVASSYYRSTPLNPNTEAYFRTTTYRAELFRIDPNTGQTLNRYTYASPQGYSAIAVEGDRIYAVPAVRGQSSTVPILEYTLTGVLLKEYSSPDIEVATVLVKEPGKEEFWINSIWDNYRIYRIGT